KPSSSRILILSLASENFSMSLLFSKLKIKSDCYRYYYCIFVDLLPLTVLLADHPGTAGSANQYHISGALGKNAVTHHADDIVYLLLQLQGVGNSKLMYIQDQIAIIGGHALAQYRLPPQFTQLSCDMAGRHRNNFYRQWKLTQDLYLLSAIHYANKLFCHGRDDFLACQRRAAAFNHVLLRVNFVGTIYIYAETVDVVKIQHRYAKCF